MKGNNKKNEKKVILNLFSYDYSLLEKYLQAMALEGWLLDCKKNSSWYFLRSEPKSIKFRIIPYKKSKNKSKEEILNRKDLSLKVLTEAGWKLIDSSDGIHIFYNDNNIPLPGEDKNLTFKLIKKHSLTSLIPPLFLCTYLFLYLFIPFLKSSFFDVLMKPTYILHLILLPIFIILYMVELIRYIIWHKKSNNSQPESKSSKKNLLKTFKYRSFARITIPWITPAIALLVLIGNEFNNEIKYPVTLPLTLEDMNVPVIANHRKNAFKSGTFLVNYTVYFHQYEKFEDAESVPPQLVGNSLVYTVYKTKFPSLYDDIMKEFIFDDPFYKKPYAKIDHIPFGAEAAYYTENDEYKSYALSYPDKVVVLTLNFEMTEEQMNIVKEKFR